MFGLALLKSSTNFTSCSQPDPGKRIKVSCVFAAATELAALVGAALAVVCCAVVWLVGAALTLVWEATLRLAALWLAAFWLVVAGAAALVLTAVVVAAAPAPQAASSGRLTQRLKPRPRVCRRDKR